MSKPACQSTISLSASSWLLKHVYHVSQWLFPAVRACQPGFNQVQLLCKMVVHILNQTWVTRSSVDRSARQTVGATLWCSHQLWQLNISVRLITMKFSTDIHERMIPYDFDDPFHLFSEISQLIMLACWDHRCAYKYSHKATRMAFNSEVLVVCRWVN